MKQSLLTISLLLALSISVLAQTPAVKLMTTAKKKPNVAKVVFVKAPKKVGRAILIGLERLAGFNSRGEYTQ